MLSRLTMANFTCQHHTFLPRGIIPSFLCVLVAPSSLQGQHLPSFEGRAFLLLETTFLSLQGAPSFSHYYLRVAPSSRALPSRFSFLSGSMFGVQYGDYSREERQWFRCILIMCIDSSVLPLLYVICGISSILSAFAIFTHIHTSTISSSFLLNHMPHPPNFRLQIRLQLPPLDTLLPAALP
jgi:hypothetical protein